MQGGLPPASTRCTGRLLPGVVLDRINARSALREPPGFRSTSREIGFGKLKKVAWAGASWPGRAGALPPPPLCLLLLPSDTKPSHFTGRIELTPSLCPAAHTPPRAAVPASPASASPAAPVHPRLRPAPTSSPRLPALHPGPAGASLPASLSLLPAALSLKLSPAGSSACSALSACLIPKREGVLRPLGELCVCPLLCSNPVQGAPSPRANPPRVLIAPPRELVLLSSSAALLGSAPTHPHPHGASSSLLPPI